MVTGSHIPDTHNGIKFYRPDGELLKSDEAPLKEVAAKLFADNIKLTPAPLPVPDSEIEQFNISRFTSLFANNSLSGLRLGIDMHSAGGRDILLEILSSLGAECFPFRRQANFIAIDTEAVSSSDLERAKHHVELHKLHVIVSTDGDGDRPLQIDQSVDSIAPLPYREYVYHGKEIRAEFFKPRCQSAHVLHFAEEPLDNVAHGIEVYIMWYRFFRI